MTASQETKDFVTPYAFHVAGDLLGTPLARPFKRLTALLIDLLVVSTLATIHGLIFAAILGIVALVGGLKALRKGQRKGAGITMLITSVMCAVVLLVGLMLDDNKELTLSFDPANNSDKPAVTIAQTDVPEDQERALGAVGVDEVSAIPAEMIEELKKVEAMSNTESAAPIGEPPSIIDWVYGVITDMGIEFGWAVLYFTVLIAWMNGQTLGKRVLGIRVIRIDGGHLTLRDSFGRYGAGLATGLLGFLQIFWDANRQAIQDKISKTMVIDLRKSRLD